MSKHLFTGRKIRGHWPDGGVATATWDAWDEWTDDHFGQGFGLSQDVIGKPEAVVLAEAKHTFWDGVIRVEWVGESPDDGQRSHDADQGRE